MAENKTKLTTEKILTEARKANLKHVQELTSMKAHGKVLGMDTFSWVNPDMDALSSVINSFPFSVLWLSTREHFEIGCELCISIHEKLETLVIYDAQSNNLKGELLNQIDTVLCVNDVESALRFIRDKERQKMIFLFTSEGESSSDAKVKFDNWISNLG